jgi:hypothetical protein
MAHPSPMTIPHSTKIGIRCSTGDVVYSIPRDTKIVFYYNNPKGRSTRGSAYRQGSVSECQNEYILINDDDMKGQIRKYRRDCMSRLMFIL